MRVNLVLAAIGIVAAAPSVAQTPTSTTATSTSAATQAQNAANWDVFLKLYPQRALAAREEGAVGFSVTIDRSGAVTQCQVTKSSGHPLLDQETCNIITLHAQFQPEQGLSGSQVRTREGMITWKLPTNTVALAAPAPVQTAALDKVVCKKSVRIGTLAGFERTCMTVREWNRQRDEAIEPWAEVQGKKGSTSGN